MSEDQHGPLLRWAQAIGDDNIVHRIEALVAENAELRAGLPAAMEHIPPVNPSEGRVPVSWNECADWVEWFGREVVLFIGDESDPWHPTTLTPAAIRNLDPIAAHLSDYRLLPPPGLVAAPEGMDGGGWLGEGQHVPEGWEWRRRVGIDWRSSTPLFGESIVQCRPPVRVRDVVEVPLTRLVGRTIEGETDAVLEPPGWSPEDNEWTWFSTHGQRFFPDGSLDLDTGRVKVEPEGEQ